jgi:hypothetical protein
MTVTPSRKLKIQSRGVCLNASRCALLVVCIVHMLPTAAQDKDGQGRLSEVDTMSSPMPSLAEVSHAIALGAGYLERACDPDGKFAYKVDIRSGKESSSYDIVRHAGAMYALAMVNRSHPDPEAVAALIRAAKYLRENYVGPGPRPGQQVVWSQPLVAPTKDRHSKPRERYAELGGAGLGLVRLHDGAPPRQQTTDDKGRNFTVPLW